jgi:hypothetical protein
MVGPNVACCKKRDAWAWVRGWRGFGSSDLTPDGLLVVAHAASNIANKIANKALPVIERSKFVILSYATLIVHITVAITISSPQGLPEPETLRYCPDQSIAIAEIERGKNEAITRDGSMPDWRLYSR